MSYYKGKNILVTGGTGSYGQELTKQLLKHDPKEIRIFSRGENAQVEMEAAFSDARLSFYIGDVRDGERVKDVMRGMDVVFHLAALKHVPIGEWHIGEFVKTNVGGVESVIRAAQDTGIDRMIFISSDKAADPINLYGYTKAIGEKMVTTANIKSSQTKFFCIRSGNLTGSHGSVVPVFRKQIERHNKVTVTDERMTRFLEIPEELVAFVLKVGAEGLGGEIFVPKMFAVDVGTLAKVMIKDFGNDKTEIKHIGARPGEKFHEVLFSHDELGRIVELPDHFVILPYQFLMNQIPQLHSYAGLDKKQLTEEVYSSENADKLSEEELRKKLKNLQPAE